MSFARRAYAYAFIRRNHHEIEKYIELRITISGSSLSTIKWADKTRRIISEYSSSKPKNQYFDQYDATLKSDRSFQISNNSSFSLTFNSPKVSIRAIGYIISIIILLFLAYLTFHVVSSFQSFGEKRASQIKHAIP